MGKDICRKFMKNWCDNVSLILKVALRSDSAKVKSVLQFYNKSDLKSSFGRVINSCFWLHLF